MADSEKQAVDAAAPAAATIVNSTKCDNATSEFNVSVGGIFDGMADAVGAVADAAGNVTGAIVDAAGAVANETSDLAGDLTNATVGTDNTTEAEVLSLSELEKLGIVAPTTPGGLYTLAAELDDRAILETGVSLSMSEKSTSYVNDDVTALRAKIADTTTQYQAALAGPAKDSLADVLMGLKNQVAPTLAAARASMKSEHDVTFGSARPIVADKLAAKVAAGVPVTAAAPALSVSAKQAVNASAPAAAVAGFPTSYISADITAMRTKIAEVKASYMNTPAGDAKNVLGDQLMSLKSKIGPMMAEAKVAMKAEHDSHKTHLNSLPTAAAAAAAAPAVVAMADSEKQAVDAAALSVDAWWMPAAPSANTKQASDASLNFKGVDAVESRGGGSLEPRDTSTFRMETNSNLEEADPAAWNLDATAAEKTALTLANNELTPPRDGLSAVHSLTAETKEALEEALKYDPLSDQEFAVTELIAKGDAMMQHGLLDAAIKYYYQASKLEPNDAQVTSSLDQAMQAKDKAKTEAQILSWSQIECTYINVEPMTARRAAMEERLTVAGIKFDRYPGNRTDDLSGMAESWEWLNDTAKELKKRHVKGVFMSHLAVYQRYYDQLVAQYNATKDPTVWDGMHLVLEDDVIVGKAGLVGKIKKVIQHLPDEWDVVRLDAWGSVRLEDKLKNGLYKAVQPARVGDEQFYGGTHAVLLQARTVRRLLEYLKSQPIKDLDRMLTTSQIESYVFRPGVIHLDPELASPARIAREDAYLEGGLVPAAAAGAAALR